MTNIVFIATSLDGFIADKEGKVDWLHTVPNPDNQDTGFIALLERIDAIVMGRNTFEIVLSFGVDWPYSKPVFVLSNKISIPKGYEDKAFLMKGDPKDIQANLNAQGFKALYIDGGITVQKFLQQDLIDEMVITQLPILLGGGSPLFGELEKPLHFSTVKTEVLLGKLVQTTYVRAR